MLTLKCSSPPATLLFQSFDKVLFLRGTTAAPWSATECYLLSSKSSARALPAQAPSPQAPIQHAHHVNLKRHLHHPVAAPGSRASGHQHAGSKPLFPPWVLEIRLGLLQAHLLLSFTHVPSLADDRWRRGARGPRPALRPRSSAI